MDQPSSFLLQFFRQVVLPYLAGTHCTILTSAHVFGGNIFTHPLAIVLLYKQHSWSYHQVHKGGFLRVLGICQLVGHRLVVQLLLRLLSPLRHRASLHVILAPARTPRIRHTFFHQDGRRSVHSGFSPRAPRQQLILAPLPLYVEMGYSVRQLGTFGRVSSRFAGGVREQRLGLLFCIGSIGACPENRIFLP